MEVGRRRDGHLNLGSNLARPRVTMRSQPSSLSNPDIHSRAPCSKGMPSQQRRSRVFRSRVTLSQERPSQERPSKDMPSKDMPSLG